MFKTAEVVLYVHALLSGLAIFKHSYHGLDTAIPRPCVMSSGSLLGSLTIVQFPGAVSDLFLTVSKIEQASAFGRVQL